MRSDLAVLRYDVVVVGSGPAGVEAAIAASTAGRRTLVVDRERGVGGACVFTGTIPSKALRDTAGVFFKLRTFSERIAELPAPETIRLSTLIHRVDDVVRGHVSTLERRLRRAGAELWHGKASFESPTVLAVTAIDGTVRRVSGELVVLAAGSRPRNPPEVDIDHEHVFDSDSFLGMEWLPSSLTVLGGGVIAAEYASIFAALGVAVTMVDRGERPLSFLDPELSEVFLKSFESAGGTFLPGAKLVRSGWNGLDAVETTLADGRVIRSDKALCALGRVANTDRLNLEAAGLKVDARGQLPVDEFLRTTTPGVVAAGDMIGPPALASTSADQGRRAVAYALGLDSGDAPETIPIGTYTVPDLASVGLDENEARKRFGDCVVGRADYSEIARGRIMGGYGLLKLVVAPDGRKLLGAQAAGEGATDLVHLAQMALIAKWDVDVFVNRVFNFPTLAEAYRVAALEVVRRRSSRKPAAAATPVEPNVPAL
jgi:NAD(P) transhydrogenase